MILRMRMLKVTSYLYSTGAVMAVPIIIPRIYAEESSGPCVKCRMKRLPKACELSLYEPQSEPQEEKKITVESGSLEHGIGIIHRQASKYLAAMDVFWNQTVEIYHTGVAHSKGTYDYLRQEENVAPRVLSIAAGGLTGMLIAIRGGVFKKILYSSTGLSAVAAACYPNEAKDYVQRGYINVFSRTNKFLKENAGYDMEKITIETKDKVGSLKDTVSFQNIINSVKETMKKIYPVEKMAQNKETATQHEDHGQSNPKDADLYTTRS